MLIYQNFLETVRNVLQEFLSPGDLVSLPADSGVSGVLWGEKMINNNLVSLGRFKSV